jgi:hypothetical protein
MSFNETISFSMTLGTAKMHEENIIKNQRIDLLKFATIYGANASGKSNLVSAIAISREVIVGGLQDLDMISKYNRNHTINEKRDTRFEYEILLNNRIYSFGFSVNARENKITKEWLYDITSEEIVVYTRDIRVNINENYLNFDSSTMSRLKIYAEDFAGLDNIIFLSYLNKEKSKLTSTKSSSIFSDIFEWFTECLEVISPEEATSDFGYTYHSEKSLDKLGEFLKLNDTGITKVVFETTEEKMKGIPTELEKKLKDKIYSELRKKNKTKNKRIAILSRTPMNIYKFTCDNGEVAMNVVRFIHGEDGVKFNFDEESDGTRRLIELFSIVSNQKKNKVFIVDELDRSLHPLLTLNFISSFLKNSFKNQLIVTTHEDRLLDLSILRRDEIWFVKKNSIGDSSLYSLEEFKERFDKNIMNAYLNGRYGATPNTKLFFSSIVENSEEHIGD